MAWIYIILAALGQTAWTYCLKFFKLSDLQLLTWHNFYTPQGMGLLWPITGYLVLGFTNAWFLSLAIKQLPTAMTFAAWTGGSIILLKITDTLFFREPISAAEVFFLTLIVGGIVGLKFVVAN